MDDEKVLYQGAEATISRTTYLGKSVVKKKRIKKTYRIKEINDLLISSRTREEAKLIHLARKEGVFVPYVYDIDIMGGVLTMSYISGHRVRDIYDDLSQEKRENLCRMIGGLIARLHNRDIIHGDITTSNMILSNNKVFLIDFGLGEINHEIEAKGVDLHVLMETMESTHSKYADDFSYILEGYEKIYVKDINQIKKKISDIVNRGRYR